MIRRQRANKKHILEKKSSRPKRRLSGQAPVSDVDTRRIIAKLLSR